MSENSVGSASSSKSTASASKISAELLQSLHAAGENMSLEDLISNAEQDNDTLLHEYYDAMLSMEEESLRCRLAYENDLLEKSQQ